MGGASTRKRAEILAVTLAIAAIALVSAAPASAANRFAEVGGNGPAATCPQLDPCSIENAINGASSATNDDVTLLGGLPPTPYVTSTALLVPTNVTVHGAPGARPVIESTAGGAAAVRIGSGSVLRDVVVNWTGVNVSAVEAVGGGLIERVTARVRAASGSSQGGCSTAGTGAITIRDSVCWQEEAGNANGGGINARSDSPGGQTLTLRNVTAISATDNRPGLSAITSAGGTMTVNATNVIAKALDTATVGDVGDFVNGATINLDHSNYDTESDTGGASITNPGTGAPNFNQTTPPSFIDAAGGDFRQAAGSTGTIDVGTATGVLPGELDFEGQNRMIGAAPDIGADEFPPPPAAPAGLGTNPASGSDDNSPFLFGNAAAGTTVEAFLTGNCSGAPFDTGPAAEFLSPGFQLTPPVADNSVRQLSARATNAGGTGPCSTAITYTEATPPPISPSPVITAPVETGERAAALKRCKQRAKKKDWSKKRLKKCRRKARQLPL